MSTAAQVQAKPAPTPSFAPIHTNLLQRKCACGGTPGPSGECAECRRKRLQLRATSQTELKTVPPIVHDVLRSPGQQLDAQTRAFMEPRFGHEVLPMSGEPLNVAGRAFMNRDSTTISVTCGCTPSRELRIQPDGHAGVHSRG
jgi:hypothetical protein